MLISHCAAANLYHPYIPFMTAVTILDFLIYMASLYHGHDIVDSKGKIGFETYKNVCAIQYYKLSLGIVPIMSK